MKRSRILVSSLFLLILCGSFSNEGTEKKGSSPTGVSPKAAPGDLVGLEGFEAKLMYDNLDLGINLSSTDNDMVPGLNDDFVIVTEEDVLIWYKPNDKKMIAHLAPQFSIDGIYPWGNNSIMVVVHAGPSIQPNFAIYKLTGPFQPAGVKSFGLH